MKKIIIMLVIFVFTLTGCSYIELNDLAIANALGIDYKDGNYEITAQILDLQQSGEGTSQTKTIIYEAKGETITEAFRNVSLSYPKMLYLSHLKLVVLGESIMESDIDSLFDYFLRSPSTRNDFDVLINPSGSAKDILNKNSEEAQSVSSSEILESLDVTTKRQGTTVRYNMEEIISMFLEENITPVVTSIEEVDKKNKLTGIVALDNKNNKVVKLSDKTATAYNLLNNNLFDIGVKFPYKDNIIDIVLIRPKNGVDVKIEGNNLTINLNINISAQPTEVRKEINLEDEKVQKEIQSLINKELKTYLISLINDCKTNNVDILGIERLIYKNHYKEYENFKDLNYCEVANFNLNVSAKLFRYGNTYRSTKGE